MAPKQHVLLGFLCDTVFGSHHVVLAEKSLFMTCCVGCTLSQGKWWVVVAFHNNWSQQGIYLVSLTTDKWENILYC